MKFQTKYFGEIEAHEADIIHFSEGLFGFESEQSFLLLPFDGSGGSMLCLQSTQTPALAFVALNPFSLCPDYTPVLQKSDLHFFHVQDAQELGYYVLCVVKHPVSDSTVNLRCPLVIHPKTRQARQIIMETDLYQMRHPLSQFGRGEEEPSC